MAIETPKDAGSVPSQASARIWKMELDASSKEERGYREEARRLLKKYEGDDNADFNILWSNVETLKPAVYSNSAQPDIRQRPGALQNKLAKNVAIVLERAVKYDCEQYDFDEAVRLCRDESLISGRGVGRVVYEVETVETEQGMAIAGQRTVTKYFNFDDFRMSPSKTWEDVRWVAFRHTPTREDLVEQFGDKGEKIPLTYQVIDVEDGGKKDPETEVFMRASLWEIWDKQSRKRIWVADGYKEIIETEDDPYRLRDFFPLPKPLYSFRIPGKMVPRSEYHVYRKQAGVLNKTQDKINKLTDELKVAGLYSAVQTEVKKLIEAGNGKLIPVMVPPGVAVKDMIAWWPVEVIANVLVQLYQARNDAKQVIYEITGISDIVRGATNAGETAAAQQIKGNYANLRMTPRQQPMQEFIKGLFKIKAEIIAEHYTAETLTQITGIPVDMQMMQILRDDKLRNYSIDVETDTTVKPDEDADKQRRTEFLTAITEAVTALAPLVQSGMIPPETAKAMLTFGSKAFKIGRELEEAIEQIGAQPQQRGPSPEMMAMQQEKESKMMDFQLRQQEAVANHDLKRQEAAANIQLKREEMMAREETQRMKIGADQQSKREIAEIGARPSTNVQFDTNGALDSVVQQISTIANTGAGLQQQQSAALSQALQIMAETSQAITQSNAMMVESNNQNMATLAGMLQQNSSAIAMMANANSQNNAGIAGLTEQIGRLVKEIASNDNEIEAVEFTRDKNGKLTGGKFV